MWDIYRKGKYFVHERNFVDARSHCMDRGPRAEVENLELVERVVGPESAGFGGLEARSGEGQKPRPSPFKHKLELGGRYHTSAPWPSH